MAKVKSPPSTLEVWGSVWGSCRALWPLFLIQSVYLLVLFAGLYLCLFILFLPLLKEYGPVISQWLEDPGAIDPQWLTQDWLAQAVDSSSFLTCLALITLYSTWWMLLSAFCSGGSFRCFWRRSRMGSRFSFQDFLKDGADLLGPMLLLQFYLFIIGSAGFLLLGTGAILGMAFLALFEIAPLAQLLVALLLGIPGCLLVLAFLVLWFAYSFTAKACVAAGTGAGPSLQEARIVSLAQGGRSLKGVSVAVFLYLLVSVPLSLFLELLGLFPVLGGLFKLVDLVTGGVLLLLFLVFTSGLAVHYLAASGRKS